MTDRALIPVLVTMMLLTGVCNTLLTKYQDLQCVRNCDAADPSRQQYFNQPVLQTAQMFVGEAGCWLIVGASALWSAIAGSRRRGYAPIPDRATAESASTGPAGHEDDLLAAREPGGEENGGPVELVTDTNKPLVDAHGRLPLTGWLVTLLALPAACDIAGTTLMNVGLLFVAASIYQMTRGALVLFVGLFSVVFLRHKLGPAKWLSLAVVVAGVALVGLAGALQKHPQKHPDEYEPEGSGTMLAIRALSQLLQVREDGKPEQPAAEDEVVKTVLGVLMIAFAQVFTASQFVLEEFILGKYSIDPIRCVGWEGIFGFIITVIAMIILHVTVGSTPGGRHHYFDAVDGWHQFTSNPAIFVSSILIMISIGGFNYFGLSVTRTISATSRSTIDTCRTLFIWIVSLGLGWETFKWLQVVGFALLVYGTFLFNEILVAPWEQCARRKREQPLLAQQSPEDA